MSAQLHERPQIRPSVKFFDSRLVNRETFRWLFYAGDIVTPPRKAQLGGWLAFGGVETDSPCLQKYDSKFIPRGLGALVEMGAQHMPEEQLRNVGGGVWQGMSQDGAEITPTLPYVPVYPGDAVANLTNRSDNDGGGPKGIVELKSLIARSWDECHAPDGSGILDKVELAFYGDGIEPTLKGLQAQITHGKVLEVLPIDIGALKNEMLLSCDQFRDWGMFKLDQEHTQLKTGTTPGGHVYTYSPLARLLLAQLEVQPQDQPFAELAKMTGAIAKSVDEAMTQRQQPQASGISMEDAVELGRKLAIAEAEIARLRNEQGEKKEHHKTREARERREAAGE